MKEIPLRCGNGRVAIVDDADYESLLSYKWRAFPVRGGHWAAVRDVQTPTGSRVIFMHRQILNAPIGLVVDHANHDTLDNRRSNIRLATLGQNAQNRRAHDGKDGTVFKGVHRQTNSKRWQAIIRVKGKLIFLGTFETDYEAAEAYNCAATKHFGDFAWLNHVGA